MLGDSKNLLEMWLVWGEFSDRVSSTCCNHPPMDSDTWWTLGKRRSFPNIHTLLFRGNYVSSSEVIYLTKHERKTYSSGSQTRKTSFHFVITSQLVVRVWRGRGGGANRYTRLENLAWSHSVFIQYSLCIKRRFMKPLLLFSIANIECLFTQSIPPTPPLNLIS